MKVKDLKIKPKCLPCCSPNKYQRCENFNKPMSACLKPLCHDILIHNDLIKGIK